MSQVNATTVYVGSIQANTLVIGNTTSTQTISAGGGENRFLYSKTFSGAAWNQTGVTLTANATIAPDGTLTAYKLTEDTSYSRHNISYYNNPVSQSSFPSWPGTTPICFSMYFKAAEKRYAELMCEDISYTDGLGYNFDLLNNGAYYTTTSYGSAIGNYFGNTTYVGNGWYRVYVPFTVSNQQNLVFSYYLTDVSGIYQTYTGDGTSGMYIWGPQLEIGTSPSSYTPTLSITTYQNISVGNVVINSTSIAAGNSVINSSGLSTNSITINGTNYTSFPSAPLGNTSNYQVFTANGTWTKPANTTSGDLITIMMWGGGGGGSANTINNGGGGGGCTVVNLLASQCNATCNVVVGLGGAAGTTGANGGIGGNSIFYANTTFSITAYGGGGGFANSTTGSSGGSGGGTFSAGAIGNSTVVTGGSPLGGNSTSSNSTFGGGAGSNNTTAAGWSVYGGGGGGTGVNAGGSSIYGGGGGTGALAVTTSTFGGKGANTSQLAGIPGGGGTGVSTYSAGARGEVRVWITHVG